MIVLLMTYMSIADEGLWPPHQLPQAQMSKKWTDTIPKLVDRSSPYLRSVVQRDALN